MYGLRDQKLRHGNGQMGMFSAEFVRFLSLFDINIPSLPVTPVSCVWAVGRSAPPESLPLQPDALSKTPSLALPSLVAFPVRSRLATSSRSLSLGQPIARARPRVSVNHPSRPRSVPTGAMSSRSTFYTSRTELFFRILRRIRRSLSRSKHPTSPANLSSEAASRHRRQTTKKAGVARRRPVRSQSNPRCSITTTTRRAAVMHATSAAWKSKPQFNATLRSASFAWKGRRNPFVCAPESRRNAAKEPTNNRRLRILIGCVFVAAVPPSVCFAGQPLQPSSMPYMRKHQNPVFAGMEHATVLSFASYICT